MTKVHYENIEFYNGVTYTMTRSANREYKTLWIVFKKSDPAKILKSGYTNVEGFSKGAAIAVSSNYTWADPSEYDALIVPAKQVDKKSKLKKGAVKFKPQVFKTGDAIDTPAKVKADKAIEALYGPVDKLPLDDAEEELKSKDWMKGNGFAKKSNPNHVKVGGPRVRKSDLESLRAIAKKRGVKIGVVVDEMISAYIEGNI